MRKDLCYSPVIQALAIRSTLYAIVSLTPFNANACQAGFGFRTTVAILHRIREV